MTLDERAQDCVQKVEKFGWMVMNVHPNAGDAGPRWFSYTVGLPVTLQMPELIWFGDDDERTRTTIVNNAIQELMSKAIKVSEGLELFNVLDGYPVRLTRFPIKFWGEHLGWAMWYARHRNLNPADFDCFQIVWPDMYGRFPTDPDCVEAVRDMQTPLLTSH